jgi:hypothetical protein
LPPLPTGRPPRRAGRHLDKPRRVPLHHQAGGTSAMSDANPQELGVLAKLVVLLAIVLIVAGVLWNGVTVEGHDLVERPDGPMRFRFILQPLMAAIAAIHDGREDARAGRSAYFMTVLRNPQELRMVSTSSSAMPVG